MPQVQLLRIVVASPGDTQVERDLVQEVAEELNHGIAQDCGTRLEVVRWETDTYPGFHATGPQGHIDSLLHIEDCDAVIGIFWKRFGTPVSDAKSGTEHEIQAAIRSWEQKGRPHIMVYFNTKPYTPASKTETDQWGQVLEFKAHFDKRGLWWTYNGKAVFEKLVRNHLTQYLRQHKPQTAILQHSKENMPQSIYQMTAPQVSAPLRALICEDDGGSTMQLRKALIRADYVVAGEATTGEAAIDLANKLSPDLILMDINMPGLIDGIEATREISLRLNAPIIMMTAYSDPGYVDAALEAGACGYLVKPFTSDQVTPAIRAASARFKTLQIARQEATDLKDEFETFKLIERAKSILMERKLLKEVEAFEQIQRMSIDHLKTIKEAAQMIIHVSEII